VWKEEEGLGKHTEPRASRGRQRRDRSPHAGEAKAFPPPTPREEIRLPAACVSCVAERLLWCACVGALSRTAKILHEFALPNQGRHSNNGAAKISILSVIRTRAICDVMNFLKRIAQCRTLGLNAPACCVVGCRASFLVSLPPKMISGLNWIPKGRAKQNPKKYLLPLFLSFLFPISSFSYVLG
jgi:hypothetical protein